MRRWNGWGDDTIEVPVGEGALHLLEQALGPGAAPRDATFEAVCAQLAPSRLPPHPLVDTAPAVRLTHALGQSLPDWLRLRYGRIEAAPDGVAFPESADQVRELIRFAVDAGAAIVPYGGGTSVCGHLDAARGRPTLSVDMKRLRALTNLDPASLLATFGAGVAGPDLEAQLRAHGYTLGHFPQSFEYSTLGGWVVTRSSGQQSLRYGRIEQLFAGGRMETPQGTLHLPTFPASSAGPDLRELVLGSEGRLGILTEATVRISPLPEFEAFHAVFLPDWERAELAVRAIVQARPELSMLRLSNPAETATLLRLAVHGKSAARQVALLEALLRLRGAGEGKCLLLVGASGARAQARASLAAALKTARRHGGVHAGRGLGERWKKNRFRNVYLRNAAWERGYAIDTVETALDWPRVTPAMHAVEQAAADALAADGERVHAYTHLSHLYAQGASVYTTFIWRLAGNIDADLARWRRLKTAVSEAIVAGGGTISHQHGVGTDHAPWLRMEKGPLGMQALQALFRQFDPDGCMNPGKLVTP
ncbi:FAD-linked oxidase [Massilia sp. WF1]|uniref:FAD-binding oxidoreductase n=1 Tax=unclassified Massilia TaxID=2609279 RepID=UPI000649C966|nr:MULTISPECIES: FAD-binding oxidoreductase [unclassified Massilia]ALK98033.1 FAD-linked oxidase [Massilia sp. WG5]KLU35506.1 FAD-linked oxidase [Massilia sp. WF1]